MTRIFFKICAFLILLCACHFSAYCQTDNATLKNIINKLKTFLEGHITEKAYLHFDKPYYAAGDTVYFKAYVTIGERHELSNLSGVLHIDFINTDNKIDQSLKLQLINGVAWGDFALPDTLPKGNYKIMAYTRWMRNDGNNGLFYQTIPIGSPIQNKTLKSLTPRFIQSSKQEILFFPEGGSFVAGIRSKVAFKAIGSDGLGVNVNGVIIDDEKNEVCSFTSSHLGMGCFFIDPIQGKKYQAIITYSNGKKVIVDLPITEVKGIALSINNDSIPKASVRVEANKPYFQENKNRNYTLVIYSAGIATFVNFKMDSDVVTMDILKRHIRTGIATITLFSSAGEPLCERLLFVQNYDQLKMSVRSNKDIYAIREKVNIKLNIKTRADSTSVGHFSISVIDESKVPIDENNENTILTNLLLTSDLKGNVENPSYYLINPTDKIKNDLDLVMLTHGYRRFEWKKLLNNEYPPIDYAPEKGLDIAGIAKTLEGKPIVKGTVSLISPVGGPVLSVRTDEKGNFQFSNLVFMDTTRFVLSATNYKGKNSVKLFYNPYQPAFVIFANIESDEDVNDKMPSYLENRRKQQDQTMRFGSPKRIVLKEVNIKEKKRDDNYRTESLAGPGNADQVIHRSEFRGGGLFSDQFNGTLRGILFVGPSGQKKAYLSTIAASGPMLIVVDGTSLPVGSPIDDINVNNIETIEVLKYANTSIYGISGGNGVLVITTRQGTGLEVKDITSTGVLPITAKGFYKAREFYSPKYDHPDSNMTRKDLRSTIYWQPELITDKDGNASFEYYNADGAGTYRVVIEGIDEKGNLGRQVYRYKVE